MDFESTYQKLLEHVAGLSTEQCADPSHFFPRLESFEKLLLEYERAAKTIIATFEKASAAADLPKEGQQRRRQQENNEQDQISDDDIDDGNNSEPSTVALARRALVSVHPFLVTLSNARVASNFAPSQKKEDEDSNKEAAVTGGAAAAGSAASPPPSNCWVPPDSFQRSTVKYWVRPEHASAVKLFILRHLPILEVNKSPPLPQDSLLSMCDSQLHNFISSMYFDSADLECFHLRLLREESAKLMRLRWYGGASSSCSIEETEDGSSNSPSSPPPSFPPRPTHGADTLCYFELKTHHNFEESQLVSTKDRFPILLKLVDGFLLGRHSPSFVVDETHRFQQQQQSPTTTSTTSASTTTQAMKSERRQALIQVANAIQRYALKIKVKPRIRTVYHRTAFQSTDHHHRGENSGGSSSSVRMTFDSPVYVLPEKAISSDQQNPQQQQQQKRRRGGRRQQQEQRLLSQPRISAVMNAALGTTNSTTNDATISPFPFSVLEIKISSDDEQQQQPEWVSRLLETGWLRRVNNFSKYQTGVVSYMKERCDLQPLWLNVVKSAVKELTSDSPQPISTMCFLLATSHNDDSATSSSSLPTVSRTEGTQDSGSRRGTVQNDDDDFLI